MNNKSVEALKLSLITIVLFCISLGIWGFIQIKFTDIEKMDKNIPIIEQLEHSSAVFENAVIDIRNSEEYGYEVVSVDEPEDITVEQMIEEACNRYGISYDICLAIARLETGWFTSHAYVNGNNVGGMSLNEVPMCFGSLDEGVEAFVSNLANNYFAIGLDTPEKIGKKYCPVNSEWASIVKELMTY